jgi:tyrosyl-tRNA synthetase
MRYDAPTPDALVLELLARADQLAMATSDAILSGDDAAMIALLDDREAVVAAVVGACAEMTVPLTGRQLAALSQASLATHATGHATCAAAERARDQVVAELAALDARQQAADDYQTGVSHGSINVVL